MKIFLDVWKFILSCICHAALGLIVGLLCKTFWDRSGLITYVIWVWVWHTCMSLTLSNTLFKIGHPRQVFFNQTYKIYIYIKWGWVVFRVKCAEYMWVRQLITHHLSIGSHLPQTISSSSISRLERYLHIQEIRWKFV